MLILDAGRIEIFTDPKQLQKDMELMAANVAQNPEEYFYHSFNLSIEGLHGAVSTVGRAARGERDGRDDVVTNVDFGIALNICNTDRDDLPEVKCAVFSSPVLAFANAL